MKKSRLGISLTLIFIGSLFLNCISSSFHTENIERKNPSFFSFPDIIVDYNSTYSKQQVSFQFQLELDNFNCLTLFFTTSGDKTNNEGIRISFIFGEIEVTFVIERLFQDHLGHNLTQLFSYPESFSGTMILIITVEAQTSLWYESGSVRIFSYSKVERIEPVIINENISLFPIVPNWLRFLGCSSSSVIRTVTTVFNNSGNFDNVNLTLSFQTNDFTAYKQHFEIYVNDQLRSTSEFREDQLTTESFLIAIDSGINFLTIDFVIEICMGEIQFSKIQLSGKGIDFEDFLPENTYSWYAWGSNEFDHSFDLTPLKPVISYSEQILEVAVDYGYRSSVATSVSYEIKLGAKTLISGEISAYGQPNSPRTITTKCPLTHSDDSLILSIQGFAEEQGVFYLLNSSYVNIEPLPELHEQGSLERMLVETKSCSTPSSEPLILTFKDFCKVIPDYLHCNVSLSFSLFSEFGYAIRQINVLVKIGLLTIIYTQISNEKQVNINEQQTLYSNLYEVTVILSIYGDGLTITLNDLKYNLSEYLNDTSSTNPFDNPEYLGSKPLSPVKSTIMYLEFGCLLLFFGCIFSQGLLKRKEEGRTARENEEEERELTKFKKIARFPKKWWLKVKESLFRLWLLPLSLCYLCLKVETLSRIADKFATIATSYSLNLFHPDLGKWGFYSFTICVFVSGFVTLSTLFLISTSTFYKDLFMVSQLVGIVILILYIPSSVLLLLYLASNGYILEIFKVVVLLFLFLNINVVLYFLRKTENKQHEKTIKSFFRTNKSETEEQIPDLTVDETVEEDLSQEQYDEYKLKLLNYIISKITPEIQVSANLFAERFHISLELAHNLLTAISNDYSGLGEYFIEEQIYKRSPTNEMSSIYLDIRSQKKHGELISKYNNNNVNSKKDPTNYDYIENQDRIVAKRKSDAFLLPNIVLDNKYTTEIKTLDNTTILPLELDLEKSFTLEFIENTLEIMGEGDEASKTAILKLEIIELIRATCFDNAHWNELVDNKGNIKNQDKWDEILSQINRIITGVRCLASISNTVPKIIFSSNIKQIENLEGNNALYGNYLKLYTKNVDKEKITAIFMREQLDLMEAFYSQIYPELTSKQARTYAKYLAAISGYEQSILGLDSTNMGETFMEAWCKINRDRDSLRRLSHHSSKSKIYIAPNSMQKFKHSFDDFILADTGGGLEFIVVESKLQNAIYNLNRNLHIKDLDKKMLEYVKGCYGVKFQIYLAKYLPNNDSVLALRIANSLSERVLFTLNILGNDFVRKMKSDGTMHSLVKETLLEKGKPLSYVNAIFNGTMNYHRLLALMQNSATLDDSNNVVRVLNLKISNSKKKLIEVPIHSDSFKLCVEEGMISIKGFTSEILDKLMIDKENLNYQNVRLVYQNLQSLVDNVLMEVNEREITKIASNHEKIIVMKYNEILNTLFKQLVKQFEDFKAFKNNTIQSYVEIAAENINKYTNWLSKIQKLYSVIPYTEIHYWYLPFQEALDNFAVRKNIKLSGSLKKLYDNMLGFNGDTILLDVVKFKNKAEIFDKLIETISKDDENISRYSLIATTLILQKANKPHRLPQGLFNKGSGKRLVVLLDDNSNHINLKNELITYPISPPTGGQPINSENEMPPINVYININDVIRKYPHLKKEMLGNFPIKYEKDANRLNIRFLGGKESDGKGANLARQYWRAKLYRVFGSDPNSSSILEKLKDNSQMKFNPRIGFDNPIVLMRMYIYLILDYYSLWCEFTDAVIGTIQTMIENNNCKYLTFPKALKDNDWELVIEDIRLLKEEKVEITYYMGRDSQRTRTYSEQGKLGLNALNYSKGEWISTHEEALFYFPNTNPYMRRIAKESINNIIKILSNKKLTTPHKEWEDEINLLIDKKR